MLTPTDHNAPWRTIPNSKLKIPNSDGDRRPPCKYRTKSKNLLQNKNQF